MTGWRHFEVDYIIYYSILTSYSISAIKDKISGENINYQLFLADTTRLLMLNLKI